LRHLTKGATLTGFNQRTDRPASLEGFMLRHLPAIAFAVCLLTLPVIAADHSFEVINQSDEDLMAITLHPKMESDPARNVLPSPIATGQSGTVTMTITGHNCVFDMILTCASTRAVTQPDRDLCQTDAIIVE